MTQKKIIRKPNQIVITTKQKLLLLVVFFLSLMIIPLSVFLAQQEQKIRKEAAPTAKLSLLPAARTVSLDEALAVEIYLETGMENDVRGGDISLNFDPYFLEVLQVTPGAIFGPIVSPAPGQAPDPWEAINQVEILDEHKGRIRLSVNTFSHPFNGQGIFGTVQFKALNLTPSTEVSFYVDPETQIIAEGGESVAAAIEAASFEIVSVSVETKKTFLPLILKGSRTTTLAIQNMASSANTVNLAYYDAEGNSVASAANNSFTLVPHESHRISTEADVAQTDFQGSAMIESSQKVAAAVLMVDSAHGKTIDMYAGSDLSETDTSLFFPIVHRQPGTHHWYSDLVIQNTDDSQIASVVLNFKTIGQSTVVFSTTADIPPRASRHFDLQNSFYEALNTNSGNQNWYGSAQVISTNGVKIAGKLLQSQAETGVAAIHSAFVSTESSLKYYIPTVHAQVNTWGWNGWIVAMNTNDTDARVRCQYIHQDGTTTYTAEETIPANSSFLFYGDNYPALNNYDDKWYGSAVLTSTNGVSFVAQYGATNLKPPKNLYYLTKGSRAGLSATSLYYPYFEGRAPGYNSWLTVQNLGDSPAEITVQFYYLDGTPALDPIIHTNVPSGASKVHSAELEGLVDFSGSAIVTANQPIAGFGSLFENNRMDSGYDVCGAYNALSE